MNKDTLIYLTKKTKKTLKEEGALSVVGKTKGYVQKHILKKAPKQMYKDILFINGCTLPHPKRYRVDHQIEQLEAYGFSADAVDYERLNIESMKYYRGFIFFRCPITEEVRKLIELAKEYNKTVFFDIDDLVIDTKYTKSIRHLETLSENEKMMYDDGVNRMKETLRLCDCAITTTEKLAEELRNYIPEVYINRNVASDRMLELSVTALANDNPDETKVFMGYLSGSITHNADVEMILPVILNLMEKYENLHLKIVGELDLPDELTKYKSRVVATPFTTWQNLPDIISTIDINLAPLEHSIFNEAKSENKWIEAALCKKVTVASNIGAFKKVINDGVNGLLCENLKEWQEKLEKVIENPNYRTKLANQAYLDILENHVTVYTGKGLRDFIESKLARNIAFILPTTNISGGVNVILKHCSILKNQGNDVFIINRDKVEVNIQNNSGMIPVISSQQTKITGSVDTMVGTLWDTLHFALGYPKVKHIKYLVQNFETDFMQYGQYARILANATYCTYKNISYITISKWCQNWLRDKYDKNSLFAPNGISLEQFPYRERNFGGKIKILIEGNSLDHYKNVDESFRIVEKLDKDRFEIHFLSYQGSPKKWYYVDKFMHKVPHDEVGKVYQDADILIKSSYLESFSYPPLEMMASGGLVVAVANGGNIEYLEDQKNCLFYELGDIEEAIQKIELLVRDRKLREKLIENGKKTAEKRKWENIEKEIVSIYE